MKHLKIEQSTSSIEVVDPKVIDKLYNFVLFHPVGESLDSTSNLKGNLQCSHAYEDAVDYLTTNYKDLSISVTGGIYIRFEDKNVETICATNWGDGTGITSVQASIISDLNGKFSNNKVITKFDELKYFINYTTIQDSCFKNSTSLTTVNLTNITTLQNSCFMNCTSLSTVNITTKCTQNDTSYYSQFSECSNLTDVGDVSKFQNVCGWEFEQCPKLLSVNLTSVCKSIGISSFYSDTVLTSVGDISGVLTIGEAAFYNCSNITGLNSTSLKNLGKRACYQCSKLTSIDLTNCTYIGESALDSCNSLTSIGTVTNATTIGPWAFKGTQIATIDINPSITAITEHMLQECSKLTSVTGCSNVTDVKEYAFYNSTLLQTIPLTTACTNIAKDAFYGCSKLTSVGNTSKVTEINIDAFNGCSKLSSIDLSSIINIDQRAFDGCTSLTLLDISNTILAIKDSAFGGCSNLTRINFGTGGTTNLYLGKQFIGNCPLLTTLVLPSNLTTIEMDALCYHDVASVITINATTVPTLNGAIGGSSDTVFYVPDSSLNAYKTAAEWSDMASRIKGMSTYPIQSTISDYTFNNWTALKTIDLSNVTNIGDYGFANSGLLNNPTVGDYTIGSSSSACTIGQFCFYNCKNLGSVTFPHLTDLGASAFKDCVNLEHVNLGNYCTSIGPLCFEGCTNLDYITCSSNITPPTIDNTILSGAKSTCKIYVHDALVDTYKAASGWSTYSDKIFSYTQQNIDFPGTR